MQFVVFDLLVNTSDEEMPDPPRRQPPVLRLYPLPGLRDWSPGNSNKHDYNRNKNNRRTGGRGRREGNTTTGGKDKNWRSGPKPECQSDGSSNGRSTMTAG